MYFKHLILFVLLISAVVANAQTDFRPGYVVITPGDTVYGQIDYRGDLFLSSICKFKKADDEIIKYSPNDITAFRFIDSKYYVSREVNNKNVFLEYLIEGKVNIYYMRDDNGDHYYIDKENERLSEIPYAKGIKYHNDKLVSYQTTKHLGLLNYYMQDAPQFQSKIKSIKKPQHQNLIKLAADYHNTVCKGEECIIYEKMEPFLKVNLEVLTGVVNFENIEGLNDKNYLQGGLFAHFWMPRVNEKFYLKTGFLYSRIEYENGNKAHVIIPLHVAYMAPNTYKIRPSISIGLISPSYSGGIAIKANKSVNFGIQGWVNYYPNPKLGILPERMLNYSILGNLYIEI